MSSHAVSVFVVSNWTPQSLPPAIPTGTDISSARLDKTYTGALEGHAVTYFLGALDTPGTSGSYVALESVEGTLGGRRGRFTLSHGSTTTGGELGQEFLVVVPGSGTDDLAGLTGTGRIEIDEDGTHRMMLDYDLP